jgi:hypothetical protein
MTADANIIQDDRQCKHKVILFFVPVTIVAFKTQQCPPFVLVTYVSVSNVIIMKTLPWEQKCFVRFVSVRTSLPRGGNANRSSYKVPSIFVRFKNKIGFFYRFL